MRLSVLKVGLFLLAIACDAPTTPVPMGPHQLFERPQALIFLNDTLIVSESGYGLEGWGTGHISSIDPSTARIENRWQTSQLNPQTMRSLGDTIAIVNTGAFDLSDFDVPRAATEGGVDLISATSINSPQAIIENWVLGLPMAPDAPQSPMELKVTDDHILITSGLSTSVWWGHRHESPPHFEVIVTNPGTDIGLGSAAVWQDRFIIVDFNSDTITWVEPTGEVSNCLVHIGSDEIAIEGAQSPVVNGNTLYVLMALSGRVVGIDLVQLTDECDPTTRVVIPSTGQVPNQMQLHNGRLYIVHSADNNIVSYDPSDGSEIRRWVLPVGSNPWHIAFDDRGQYMAVTEWGANAVSIINLANHDIRRVTTGTSAQGSSESASSP